MRKIEQEMLAAIKAGRDWNKDNTAVIRTTAEWLHVALHGNVIAAVCASSGAVTACIKTLRQWPTPTTKSRLRALGCDVTTKKGVTYLDGVAI